MAIAGLSFFREPFTLQKFLGIILSITGLILLAGSK
jgi:multidrug transporter EmrE-like cation transporter